MHLSSNTSEFFVLFRRDAWPLDGMKFETLNEMQANKIPENLEIDVESHFDSEEAGSDKYEEDADKMASNDQKLSDATTVNESGAEGVEEDEEEAAASADLGSGWGRIIYMPFRRGKRVELDIFRSTNSEGTEGSFDRVVITQSKNPKLHHQARRSIWG
ncbi:hypothetical protein SASPL_140648 [Salvia splendens]|uniref:Uncharacterized protein n=1 Tax=Salvia splendens TaxID=180675 RepID=A0A8X8WQ48_SALSN|nr:hypothetical protein SASPL_140648 [Salvia splendens]